MKDAIKKLLKVKSLVTVMLTIGMVLLLLGVAKPPTEVLALYSTAYGSIITYFFTKKDKEDQ